jgi:uncharacterized protein YndB with AHSA1/START domain
MSLEPIVRQIDVGRPPADAFRIFTEGLGTWWPADRFSMAADDEGNRPERVVFEPSLGGRIFEVWADGSEHLWGRVTGWEPPARVVFDWKPNDLDHPFTEVEVTFAANAAGGTTVRLEHRKWELLGADLGARGRASYANGWPYVLDERFAGAAA